MPGEALAAAVSAEKEMAALAQARGVRAAPVPRMAATTVALVVVARVAEAGWAARETKAARAAKARGLGTTRRHIASLTMEGPCGSTLT